MIYPDVAIETYIKRYPVLKEGLPLCEHKSSNYRVWRTNKSVGIECTLCNTSVWQRTKPEDNQKLLDLITESD